DVVYLGVMKLIEVDHIFLQALETCFAGADDVLAAPVLRSDAVADDIANFGSDVNSVPFRRQRCTEDPFAAAVAVNISRIEKIDAQFARTSHRGNGIALRSLAPSPLRASGFAGAADRPAAKSDFADFESGLSEDAIVHNGLSSLRDRMSHVVPKCGLIHEGSWKSTAKEGC